MNEAERNELVSSMKDEIEAEVRIVYQQGGYQYAVITEDAVEFLVDMVESRVADAPKEISVEFACGSQEYWDLEPDGSLLIDIPHDRVVVSSTDLDDAPGMGLQNEITEWANARFGGKDDHQRFTKLQNEVAELGRLSVNNRDGIEDECADIMHLLFQYAYWYRFDLLEATRKKFEINKQRTWEPQMDGTYQHVKGGQ